METRHQHESKNRMVTARQLGWKNPKLIQTLLIAGLVLFALAINVSRAVRADYSHDEDQFLASARLLLDENLLPYRDYPYFHTPYLAFIYALLFDISGGYNLLAARLFSALCATASVVLVFFMVLHFFRTYPWKVRYLVGFTIAFLYLTNPLLAATAGFSWNHNLSGLCMLGSLWLFLLASARASPGAWFLISGVLLGVAVGVRSSSLTLLPAYLLAIGWLPGGFSRRGNLRLGLIFLAGFGLALLPLLWMFILAPQQFIFGNLGYARLNAVYRLDVPVAYEGNLPIYGAQTPAEKIGFLWEQVITQPGNILLFAGLIFFGWSTLPLHLGRREEHASRNILLFSALPLVAMGSFLPTPTWYQYFYAPLPFALLAIGSGLTYLAAEKIQARKWFLLLLVQLVLLSSVIAYQDFRRMSYLRYADLWKPLVIHRVGMEIRDQLGSQAKVFTIAPLYPLEGGLLVYPPLATGVFAFRTGSLLDEAQRQQQGIVSRENFEAYLDGAPPEAILVGFNEILEEPIVRYALSRGFTAHPLDKGLVLWLRPAPFAP